VPLPWRLTRAHSHACRPHAADHATAATNTCTDAANTIHMACSRSGCHLQRLTPPRQEHPTMNVQVRFSPPADEKIPPLEAIRGSPGTPDERSRTSSAPNYASPALARIASTPIAVTQTIDACGPCQRSGCASAPDRRPGQVWLPMSPPNLASHREPRLQSGFGSGPATSRGSVHRERFATIG
jgi:hypothetical protein